MKKPIRHIFFILIISCTLISFQHRIEPIPELIDFNSSECKEDFYYSNLYKLVNRILGVKIKNEYKIYEIFVVTDCGRASYGGIEITNDTLNLIYDGTPYQKDFQSVKQETSEIEITEEVVIEMDCDCGFDLTYKIKGLTTKEYVVVANGKTISQTPHKYRITRDNPKFDIVNNDTINLIDIYGLKQGLHIIKRPDGKLYRKLKFIDDEHISGLVWIRYNYEGFDRVETLMEDKNYTKMKYYKGDVLVKECDTDGTLDEGTNCKHFE